MIVSTIKLLYFDFGPLQMCYIFEYVVQFGIILWVPFRWRRWWASFCYWINAFFGEAIYYEQFFFFFCLPMQKACATTLGCFLISHLTIFSLDNFEENKSILSLSLIWLQFYHNFVITVHIIYKWMNRDIITHLLMIYKGNACMTSHGCLGKFHMHFLLKENSMRICVGTEYKNFKVFLQLGEADIFVIVSCCFKTSSKGYKPRTKFFSSIPCAFSVSHIVTYGALLLYSV